MYNVRRGVLQKVSAESVEHTNWNSNMIHMVHQLLRVRVRVRVACEDVRPNLLQTCEELLLLLLLLLCLLHALKSHGNGLGENGLLLLLLLLLLLHALQSQGNWLGQSGLLLLLLLHLLLHMLLHLLLQHGKQAWECGKDVRGWVRAVFRLLLRSPASLSVLHGRVADDRHHRLILLHFRHQAL